MVMARTKAGIAVQAQMTRRGLTQLRVAQALRKSQTWVSQSLLDDTARTLRRLWINEPDTLDAFLDLMGWGTAELEAATGVLLAVTGDEVALVAPDLRSSTRSIPVFDLLSAGPGSDGGTMIAEIDIPESWKGPHAAYVVSGDSMSPLIPDGATIVVKRQEHATPGNVVVAWVPEHGMVVKNLERTTREGLWLLTSVNPAYAPIWAEELTIFGVVREVRTRIAVVNGNHAPS